MTLTQLEYILALDTYRQFVLAAEHCNITQPTLSMQVQKMEEELGIILFDRSKQPISPTSEGEIAIKQARLILQEVKRLKEMMRYEKTSLSGSLNVGIIPTLSPYLLPLFVQDFLASYPNIQLQIKEITTTEILQLLRNETLDVGILATPLKETNFNEKPLFYESFVAYLPKESPLTHKKLLTDKDIFNQHLLLPEEEHCLRDQILSFCKLQKGQATLQPNFRYNANNLETQKRLVELGMGIAILPELAIQDMPEEQIENVRYFEAPEPVREISLVYTRAALKSKLIDCLEQSILKHLPHRFLEKQTLDKQIITNN